VTGGTQQQQDQVKNLFAELDETNKLQAWMKVYLAFIGTAMGLLSCSMDEEKIYVLQASKRQDFRSLLGCSPGGEQQRRRPVAVQRQMIHNTSRRCFQQIP
jgi:hypothetical protein